MKIKFVDHNDHMDEKNVLYIAYDKSKSTALWPFMTVSGEYPKNFDFIVELEKALREQFDKNIVNNLDSNTLYQGFLEEKLDDPVTTAIKLKDKGFSEEFIIKIMEIK